MLLHFYDEGVYFLHSDHLGTANYVTDHKSNTTQFFLNLPFGEMMAEQQVQGEYENPYKFNAKELDTETELYYYGARYYNPRLSVWYGVDPLAIWNPVMETEFYGDGQHNGGVFFWGNLNPYIYTYQNPIRYIDPNGKQAITWALQGSRTITVLGTGGALAGGLGGGVIAGGIVILMKGDQQQRKFQYQNSRQFSSLSSREQKIALLRESFPVTEQDNLSVRTLPRSDIQKIKILNAGERVYEPNLKHGNENRGNASKAPTNPQESLDNSFQVSPNSTRRVGYDPEAGEFNVFDEHSSGKFHGHSREWGDLNQDMKNTLIKNKVTNVKGKPLK